MLIGDLAKQSNFSRDTIRYYEKLGLLTQSQQADNGYKYYSWYDPNFSVDLIYGDFNQKRIHQIFMNLMVDENKTMFQFIFNKKQFKHINDNLTLQLKLLLLKCNVLTCLKLISFLLFSRLPIKRQVLN